MKTALLLLASLSLLPLITAACRSTSTCGPNGGLPFRTLLRGDQTGIGVECVRVVRTADEWNGLWREHTTRVLPRPEPPAVDWKKDMVVLVAIGSRPSAGYGVEIDKLALDGQTLRVEAHETKPPEGLLVPMIVTSPYHLVTTPRHEGPVQLALR